jgi:hypothetical protein
MSTVSVASGSGTYTAKATKIYSNIIKTALTLGEFSKQVDYNIKFDAIVVPANSSTDSFNITLTLDAGCSNMNIGFFILVITNQINEKFVDIIPISYFCIICRYSSQF